MKKLLALLCGVVLLASCSDDEPSFDAASIEGEWVNTDIYKQGAWIGVPAMGTDGTRYSAMNIEFGADGRFLFLSTNPAEKFFWEQVGPNTIQVYTERHSSIVLFIEPVSVSYDRCELIVGTGHSDGMPMRFRRIMWAPDSSATPVPDTEPTSL